MTIVAQPAKAAVSAAAAKRPAVERAPVERILGLSFFNGPAAAAVAQMRATGGCAVMPASPALTKLQTDESYRLALQGADVVLADSDLLTMLWRLVSGRRLLKVSGISYLRELLADPDFRPAPKLWVVASRTAQEKATAFLRQQGLTIRDEDFYLRDARAAVAGEHALLLEIENRRPEHIVIAASGGGQEQLGVYLRDYLMHRPSIHCVGAALAFLSGHEHAMPEWAQRSHLSWLVRLALQPRLLVPRLAMAATVARLVLRFRSELPPLSRRWADL